MDRKSVLTLFYVSLGVTAFTLIFFNNHDQLTPENIAITFGISLMYSFVLGMGNGFVNDFLSKRYSWTEQTRTRVVAGVLGTLAVNIIGVLLIDYIVYIVINKRDPAQFFSGNMLLTHWITMNIALLIAAILHAKDFMEEWKKAAKTQVTEQKIIAKSANAQFESLKNQLDPHFLFNSLNVLDALIEENPRRAQEFTNSMSKVYRYVLDEKDKELVTVEEELDFAKTYCELLKTRFEDSVNFEISVEEKVRKMFVVPLSLQLLLENAIKHNFATDSKPLMIRIYSENQKLIIENNLQKREVISEREGIGLSNIVQRYSLLTTEAVTIDQSEDYFKIKLPILTEKISAMTTEITKDIAYERAAERVKELKKFYIQLTIYGIAMALFSVFIQTPGKRIFFWIFGIWGAIIIVRAVRIFIFGDSWEEKKIHDFINESKSINNEN